MPRKITVLVADDHAIVKEGLVALLREQDFDVVGAVGDGEQLIESARRLSPDVIVTDWSMPGLTGMQALERLKSERLASRIIMLTMHSDGERAAQAMRAGASGFVLKESAGEELVYAIQQAMQGRVYITPAVTKAVMESMSTGRAAPELTARQREVLRLVAGGKSTKEIAFFLNLSVKTVETHRAQIMERLGIRDVPGLVRYALRTGLVPPDS